MSEHRTPAPASGAIAPTLPLETVPDDDPGPTAPVSLQPGERVSHYLVEECLGVGGMGVVYRARDTQLGRAVALKLLSPRLGDDLDLLARFRGEAQIQARLTGRHIVTLHTVVQADAGLVLVMEYVEGRTLARQLARHGPLAPVQALRVFDHALRGLVHAHRLGVVHCDLKPGNIFLTRDGEVKLMDFGLAHLMTGRRFAGPHPRFGTPRYMAPEQIDGGGADFRSDLYALGVSLYEAVTGQAPFGTDDPQRLHEAHRRGPPPAPSALVPGIPPALDAIIRRALAYAPEARYQGAEDMHAAVQALRRELVMKPIIPRPARVLPTLSGRDHAPPAPPFTYSRAGSDSRPSTYGVAAAGAWRRPLARSLTLYILIPVAALAMLSLALGVVTIEYPDVWLARIRAWLG